MPTEEEIRANITERTGQLLQNKATGGEPAVEGEIPTARQNIERLTASGLDIAREKSRDVLLPTIQRSLRANRKQRKKDSPLANFGGDIALLGSSLLLNAQRNAGLNARQRGISDAIKRIQAGQSEERAQSQDLRAERATLLEEDKSARLGEQTETALDLQERVVKTGEGQLKQREQEFTSTLKRLQGRDDESARLAKDALQAKTAEGKNRSLLQLSKNLSESLGLESGLSDSERETAEKQIAIINQTVIDRLDPDLFAELEAQIVPRDNFEDTDTSGLNPQALARANQRENELQRF
jgi:hypothetical protein